MKKSVWLAVFVSSAFMASSGWAKSDAALLTEAKANVVTVTQAKNLKDETGVTLTGQIVRQLKPQGDDFEFKDSTGSIILDVDDDLWMPLSLKAGDQVRVIGEVDTHRVKPTEIEVIHIERIK